MPKADKSALKGVFKPILLSTKTFDTAASVLGEGFDLRLDPADPAATAEGRAYGPVDLTWLCIMDQILSAVTAPNAVNFANMMLEYAGTDGAPPAESMTGYP